MSAIDGWTALRSAFWATLGTAIIWTAAAIIETARIAVALGGSVFGRGQVASAAMILCRRTAAGSTATATTTPTATTSAATITASVPAPVTTTIITTAIIATLTPALRTIAGAGRIVAGGVVIWGKVLRSGSVRFRLAFV